MPFLPTSPAGRAPARHNAEARRTRPLMLALAAVIATTGLSATAFAKSVKPTVVAAPDFGPNVHILTPDMALADIQTVVDGIAARQVSNQFGPERDAVLFMPGAYGTPAAPLNFQVGYNTAVAGLGRSPTDVTVTGSINVYNQCDSSGCFALSNFWRSLSNLNIEVSNSSFGCYAGEFWAVSQAAPMRRVRVNGNTTLMDYCTGPSYASGGFIADSKFENTVINGSQQQWLVRDSAMAGWSNGVWNQVFSGVLGAPAQCFPGGNGCGPYTTLATSPVTREAPYLYVDSDSGYKVFVPALRRNSSGTTWANGPTAGTAIPIADFFIAKPSDSVTAINQALAAGKHLILTPGVYNLSQTIVVKRANTVVLGLGFPTLVPQGGVIAMKVTDVPGVDIAGVVFDAGPVLSSVLLQVGTKANTAGFTDQPGALHDVFFRIGGMAAGSATNSLAVNTGGTLLDNIWAWRADHGNGVGWTVNPADHGVIVNGDDVTAYGLFVEHYQKYQAIWNGERGKVIFFQNEMPYDPPSQAAWSKSPTSPGWAALKVDKDVKAFNAWALGSYTFFNQGIDIFAARAFEVPRSLPKGSLKDITTIFLDPSHGMGGTLNVINSTGGPALITNPSTPVTVTSFP